MTSRVICLVALAACDPAEPLDNSDATTSDDDDTKADGTSCTATAPIIELRPGSTRKVQQLTGDDDRELSVPTANQTSSRFGLWGTDLGASFEHAGQTILLFGDSIPTGATANPECGDAIAITTDVDPSDGLALDFLTGADGLYRAPSIPGVRLGCYEVPLDGMSANGAMYVWFSTDTMTRSVLARSSDGITFEHVHDLSSSRFVNVSAVRDGEHVLLFGSGTYRASDVYLARVAATAIEDRSAYEFFAGMEDDGCTERWIADETGAVPLFGPACVGELSAHHLPALDAWIVLYNCDQPRGIQARIGRSPTGPWSEQATVFEPWADAGYCHFMHASHAVQHCDDVHDAGREDEWGGEYGPYIVESLTEPLGEHAAALHFVLSTWNPYNTMLVRTELGWR